MTTEEKAKAYDELKVKAQKLEENGCFDKLTLFVLFPELKESEDEKTKRILHSISSKMSFHLRDIFTEEEFQCFDAWSNAWLKKQGKTSPILSNSSNIGKVEQKPAINMITPEESLGVDSDTYSKIVDECVYGEQKPAWSEKDEAKLKSILFHIEDVENKDVIDWLKTLKDRVQPKQEWSEEDEKKRTLLISILEVNHPNSYFKVNPANTLNMEAMYTEELISWLKSLKERYTWKPSDEQMSALSKAIAFVFDSNSDVKHSLESLYNELKKL